MNNATFAAGSVWSVLARQLIFATAFAGAVISTTAIATLAEGGATTVSAQPAAGTQGTGPDFASITGARVGAPSEQNVSTYGGSHKHLWVEQQLYGPGVVHVPSVDTTVHQSR